MSHISGHITDSADYKTMDSLLTKRARDPTYTTQEYVPSSFHTHQFTTVIFYHCFTPFHRHFHTRRTDFINSTTIWRLTLCSMVFALVYVRTSFELFILICVRLRWLVSAFETTLHICAFYLLYLECKSSLLCQEDMILNHTIRNVDRC